MSSATAPARLIAVAARPPNRWAWLAGGFAVGFLVPFLFSEVLEVPRDAYYAIYGAATVSLLAAWLRAEGQSLRAFLAHRWAWGVGLGALAAIVIVLGVLQIEDATARPDGLELAGAILWRGAVYGAVDGLLLSVFPILVVYAALRPHRRRFVGKLGVGGAALVASLAMTAVYHAGYSDFRSDKLRKPVFGDVVWSMPTLLTASPLGAPIAHAALHVTAVVHSYDTDLFLPPHDDQRRQP